MESAGNKNDLREIINDEMREFRKEFRDAFAEFKGDVKEILNKHEEDTKERIGAIASRHDKLEEDQQTLAKNVREVEKSHSKYVHYAKAIWWVVLALSGIVAYTIRLFLSIQK